MTPPIFQKTQKTYAVFIFILLLFFSACAKEEQAPLRIGNNVWPGYEPLYLARSLGYFDNTPIHLVEFPSASEVLRAYNSKAIEGAGLTMDEVLQLAENRQDPRVVAIMDFSHGGDVILGKPDIPDMPGLKGKRVGVEATALGAYVLTRALETNGMALQDIQIVSLEVNEHLEAFKKDQVDAVVTFGPVHSTLLEKGARLLFDSSKIPGEIVDVLTIRSDFIRDNPETVRLLLEGWFKAIDYMKKNPEDAARRMAPREKVTPEEFMASLKGLQILSLQENQDYLRNKESSFYKGLGRLSSLMLERKLLKVPMDPLSLIDPGPLSRLTP